MRRKRFILRHGDVRTCTPHSSGFARLASGAFYFVVSIMTFYEFIKFMFIHYNLWDTVLVTENIKIDKGNL